jgi:MYXO-CTERM domain-containing protein
VRGIFCSSVPVDQSGEQILFSIDGSHVTAHIQISYQGAAKDFAWVVPVSTRPTLSLGSRAVFQQLLQQTQPQFSVLWPPGPGSCGFGGRGAAMGPGGAPPPAATPADSGVVVLDQREVGPFETVILESHDSQALVDWLNKNHFDQPPAAVSLIDHYVKLGMLFVGLRLTKDATSGDIQPIVLDMDNDSEACVPLILTRIAAVPDLPIYVFVLGNQRAVPRNWFEVEINQRRIDWFSGGTNYKALVTEAINDGAGHGFVTEYAGPSSFMKSVLYAPDRWNLDRLRTVTDPGLFVQAIQQIGLPRDQTMLSLLRKHIPLPAVLSDRGVTEQQFYNTLASQPGAYRAELAGLQVDPAAFIADLQERVIKPLQDAQALFDSQPYLTRLFSTVSPDEMTRDPLFQFNADLKTVSNYHRALATGVCNSDGSYGDLTLTFENGEQLQIKGPVQPFGGPIWAHGAGELAARRIALIGRTGEPMVYSSAQARAADRYLNDETPEAVRARTIPGAPDPGQPVVPRAGGGGCSTGGEGRPVALALLLAAAALLRSGRRRRSRARCS